MSCSFTWKRFGEGGGRKGGEQNLISLMQRRAKRREGGRRANSEKKDGRLVSDCGCSNLISYFSNVHISCSLYLKKATHLHSQTCVQFSA